FLSAPYFNVILIVLKLPSSIRSYFVIYPSFTRMSAIATFILEAGTSTVSCFAVFALRILVSISAIGSLIVIFNFLLMEWFILFPDCGYPFSRSSPEHAGEQPFAPHIPVRDERKAVNGPTSLLSLLPEFLLCKLIHGSRYGKYHIFLNMHADGRRFYSDCILLWRISVCAAV